jgi:hypothetical protein
MEPNVPAPTPISGGDDPISKSALVRGIVSVCVCWLPIGSIIGIIFGISALKRAKLGRQAIEASGGTLRGKGAQMAGKICGIVGIAGGSFMTLYYIFIFMVFFFVAQSRPY